MKNPEHKNDDGKRYLKKYEIVETDVELPIQGQVRDPEDLYVFLKDLESDQVPKIIGVYLDENHLFLAHQVFLGQTSATFETQLFHFYYNIFLAKRFIVLINPRAVIRRQQMTILNFSRSSRTTPRSYHINRSLQTLSLLAKNPTTAWPQTTAQHATAAIKNTSQSKICTGGDIVEFFELVL